MSAVPFASEPGPEGTGLSAETLVAMSRLIRQAGLRRVVFEGAGGYVDIEPVEGVADEEWDRFEAILADL